MQSEMWRLSGKDVIKGAVTSVIAALLLAAYNIVSEPGFNILAVDWLNTFNMMLNVAISAFLADLVRRLGTDQNGKLFGKI